MRTSGSAPDDIDGDVVSGARPARRPCRQRAGEGDVATSTGRIMPSERARPKAERGVAAGKKQVRGIKMKDAVHMRQENGDDQRHDLAARERVLVGTFRDVNRHQKGQADGLHIPVGIVVGDIVDQGVDSPIFSLRPGNVRTKMGVRGRGHPERSRRISSYCLFLSATELSPAACGRGFAQHDQLLFERFAEISMDALQQARDVDADRGSTWSFGNDLKRHEKVTRRRLQSRLHGSTLRA